MTFKKVTLVEFGGCIGQVGNGGQGDQRESVDITQGEMRLAFTQCM